MHALHSLMSPDPSGQAILATRITFLTEQGNWVRQTGGGHVIASERCYENERLKCFPRPTTSVMRQAR
jgi:hypothetical protein